MTSPAQSPPVDGNPAAAVELTAGALGKLVNAPWFAHVARRLVAEAAIADGWGDPAAWLREALVFFEANGLKELARASRSLLRMCGATASRRRVIGGAPADLDRCGITEREADVLAWGMTTATSVLHVGG